MRLRLYDRTLRENYDIPDIDQVIIGRNSEECELAIPCRRANKDLVSFVSKQHCRIQLDGNDYHIFDVGSRNGTFVNNEQVCSETGMSLKDGDKIRLGPYELDVFIYGDEPPTVITNLNDVHEKSTQILKPGEIE